MFFNGHGLNFDESLSYTNAKGNPQTAKAGHVWCDIIVNVSFHIRVI